MSIRTYVCNTIIYMYIYVYMHLLACCECTELSAFTLPHPLQLPSRCVWECDALQRVLLPPSSPPALRSGPRSVNDIHQLCTPGTRILSLAHIQPRWNNECSFSSLALLAKPSCAITFIFTCWSAKMHRCLPQLTPSC